MPDGLFLLALALTLVVNAALIAVAIRAMRPGGAFHEPDAAPLDRRDEARDREVSTRATRLPFRPESMPGVDSLPRVVEPPRADLARVDTRTPPVSAGAAAVAPSDVPEQLEPPADGATGAGAAQASEPTSSRAPARRRRTRARAAAPDLPPPDAAAPTRPPITKASTGNGRRRRFSLPPLDADSDKVSRSIESFLSGGDAPVDGDAATDREPDQPPTTVALVAVIRGSGGDDAAPLTDGPADDAAVVAVERSLRAAARGTDQVEALGDGRFRLVLVATGELAARAYLRRVRATVATLLDDLDPPRRLAAATATILGEPLDQAFEVAERRLAAAIEATSDVADEPADETRAAGD